VRILDTDTDIEVLRGNPAVQRKQDEVSGRIGTTIISVAELYYGAEKSRVRDIEIGRVERFLESVDIVGLDVDAARIFGETKALLERDGQRLPDADLLIAAICLSRSATLVTGNTGHFARIAGLAVEDWIRG
jgi:tRNA(fMet)-specific endonuclease VapC